MTPQTQAYFAARIAAGSQAADTCISCGGTKQIRDDVFKVLWPCLMCRVDDEPPERKGCGQCRTCKSGNRYGCSRDASLTDAVMTDVRYQESL